LTLAAPKMTPIGPDLCYDTQQNWEIPRHEVQLLRRLGEGNFAEVYYGHWRGKVDGLFIFRNFFEKERGPSIRS